MVLSQKLEQFRTEPDTRVERRVRAGHIGPQLNKVLRVAIGRQSGPHLLGGIALRRRRDRPRQAAYGSQGLPVFCLFQLELSPAQLQDPFQRKLKLRHRFATAPPLPLSSRLPNSSRRAMVSSREQLVVWSCLKNSSNSGRSRILVSSAAFEPAT